VIGVGPSSAESATGLTEKMPRRDVVQAQSCIAKRRAKSCSGRHPPSNFKLS
jgi:hypothetical protein